MPDAALDAARDNTIFPVETFGDALIVSPKGDKAGFGEADFRVESGRVADALKADGVNHLVVDFSLTNYVGGDVVEVLDGWAKTVRGRGGRAVACEASDDMRRGLAVAGRIEGHDDWPVYGTRDEALKEVATETAGQKLRRYAPGLLAALAVLLLVGLGAWLLTGRHAEERLYADLNGVWRDYADLRKQYPNPAEWADHTPELLDRLDAQVADLVAADRDRDPAMGPLLEVAQRRLRPILLNPRSPDPRAVGVQAGLDYVRADLDDRPDREILAAYQEYRRTGGGDYVPFIDRNWDDPAGARAIRNDDAPDDPDDPEAARRRDEDFFKGLGVGAGDDDRPADGAAADPGLPDPPGAARDPSAGRTPNVGRDPSAGRRAPRDGRAGGDLDGAPDPGGDLGGDAGGDADPPPEPVAGGSGSSDG